MEERVVGGVAGAALLEDCEGLREGEPFCDAEAELMGVLHLFEGEEVLPLGVVLDAGDAVGEGVIDGCGEGATALFERWRRDFAEDEGVGGGLAQDACRGAGGVTIDPGSGWVGGVSGDACGEESGGVGDCHVLVDATEDCGVASGDGVQIGAGGKLLAGPEGVVPTAAFEPCSGLCRGGVGADAILHLGEGFGADQVDREVQQSGVAHVGVGIVDAGHGEVAAQVDDFGLGTFQLQQIDVGAYGCDLALGDGDCGYFCWCFRGIVGAKVGSGEDVAMDVDGFGGIILGVEEQAAEEEKRADGKGFHGVSVSSAVIFCGDLNGVQEDEEDAAEGGLAAGGVVPLLEGVDSAAGSSGAYGDGG
ncbi:MAG: hypothetical protein JWQ42_3916 [Edaphobacter sp.]|nr:hypothetical protein [Edaphobacter sp.]